LGGEIVTGRGKRKKKNPPVLFLNSRVEGERERGKGVRKRGGRIYYFLYIWPVCEEKRKRGSVMYRLKNKKGGAPVARRREKDNRLRDRSVAPNKKEGRKRIQHDQPKREDRSKTREELRPPSTLSKRKRKRSGEAVSEGALREERGKRPDLFFFRAGERRKEKEKRRRCVFRRAASKGETTEEKGEKKEKSKKE